MENGENQENPVKNKQDKIDPEGQKDQTEDNDE